MWTVSASGCPVAGRDGTDQPKEHTKVPAPTMAPQQMYLDEKTILTQKTDATSALVNQAQTQASMLKHQCAELLQLLKIVESRVGILDVESTLGN